MEGTEKVSDVDRAYIRPYSVAWASSGSVIGKLFHTPLTRRCGALEGDSGTHHPVITKILMHGVQGSLTSGAIIGHVLGYGSKSWSSI
jgi:hypothetical protein